MRMCVCVCANTIHRERGRETDKERKKERKQARKEERDKATNHKVYGIQYPQ